ncbi:MAG: cobalamin-binding protein [Gemmatimonadetes bacterium]|nr:cobalamin-binding protein [Gemmatimonadota bacterium]
MLRTPPSPRAALLLLLALAGCGSPEGRTARDGAAADSAVTVTDDAGRTVTLPRPARRVVALIPSATETLFALGAGDRVVGRTDYDEAPEAQHLPSVGGGLTPSLETLLSLRPELVVAWEENKSPALRQRLEEQGIAVFALRTRDTTDVFLTIERLGHLVGHDQAADSLSRSIRAGLAEVRASVQNRPHPSVFYIVWNDPPMTTGPNTFLAQVIGVAGGRTLFPDVQADWPTVSLEEIVRRQPDVVVRPVGEQRAHSAALLRDAPGWRDLRAVREGRVVEVSADLMNRPGPHLAEAARAMRDALHPDLASERP